MSALIRPLSSNSFKAGHLTVICRQLQILERDEKSVVEVEGFSLLQGIQLFENFRSSTLSGSPLHSGTVTGFVLQLP